MTDWQPISKIPKELKDGRDVLLYVRFARTKHRVIARFLHDKWLMPPLGTWVSRIIAYSPSLPEPPE